MTVSTRLTRPEQSHTTGNKGENSYEENSINLSRNVCDIRHVSTGAIIHNPEAGRIAYVCASITRRRIYGSKARRTANPHSEVALIRSRQGRPSEPPPRSSPRFSAQRRVAIGQCLIRSATPVMDWSSLTLLWLLRFSADETAQESVKVVPGAAESVDRIVPLVGLMDGGDFTGTEKTDKFNGIFLSVLS